MSEACAAIVARDDPHLHATALFAPEPQRSDLMVLYAFDCELSRAARSSSESLIPRMRLQWWRDVIAETEAGQPEKAHDVAGPLAVFLRASREHGVLLDATPLGRMIDGHGQELEGLADLGAFKSWAVARFAVRTGIASYRLGGRFPEVARDAGLVLGVDLALRTARPMAARGQRPLVPELGGADLSALARGELTESSRSVFVSLAGDALNALERLRTSRAEWGRAATPALLPLSRAARVLHLVSRPSFDLGQLDRIDRPFDGLRLTGRALFGRW